jgi:hypothetical protein
MQESSKPASRPAEGQENALYSAEVIAHWRRVTEETEAEGWGDATQRLRATIALGEVRALLDHIDALAQRLDAAEQDSTRLDWLQAHGEEVIWIDPQSGDASAVHLAYEVYPSQTPCEVGGRDLREAIDAAMQATETPTPAEGGRDGE